MAFESQYIAHTPDAKGMIHYSEEEHLVWQRLFERQIGLAQRYACETFLNGISRLGLSRERIPQLSELNQRLLPLTQWQVVPVKALISAREFFELLATCRFPAATFIRHSHSLDYVQEPDIFHELFGHAPMLTDPVYAHFLQAYAKRVLTFPESQWALLQRLFWFTVEFGLIQSPAGLKAYGGGILSSISETPYSIESPEPLRVLFHPVSALRTPYRIDQKQAIYFVIPDFNALYQLAEHDLAQDIKTAQGLGEFPPFFSVEPNNPSIHIFAC